MSDYKIDNITFDNYQEYREYLESSENYLNSYKVWTSEEDCELKNLSKTLSIDELSLYFKRKKGSIKSRIKKLNGGYQFLQTKKVRNQIDWFLMKNEEIIYTKNHLLNCGFVYVLKCKNQKIYVGFTKTEKRISNHFTNFTTSSWTDRYPPVNIIKVLVDKPKKLEQWLTQFLMIKYGINNVRGGSYTQSNDYSGKKITFKDFVFDYKD